MNDLAAAARLLFVGFELVVVIIREHLGGGGLGGLLLSPLGHRTC
jgi:hypothetical protein